MSDNAFHKGNQHPRGAPPIIRGADITSVCVTTNIRAEPRQLSAARILRHQYVTMHHHQRPRGAPPIIRGADITSPVRHCAPSAPRMVLYLYMFFIPRHKPNPLHFLSQHGIAISNSLHVMHLIHIFVSWRKHFHSDYKRMCRPHNRIILCKRILHHYAIPPAPRVAPPIIRGADITSLCVTTNIREEPPPIIRGADITSLCGPQQHPLTSLSFCPLLANRNPPRPAKYFLFLFFKI